MKAVIFAGGFGKRLKPLTDDRPKPMIEVSGVPILEWQIDWLRRNRICELILCLGYRKEMIFDHIGSGKKFGMNVGYSVEEEPLGTGGALKNAEALIDADKFIAMNGDILTDLDPWTLCKTLSQESVGTIAAVPLRSPYGVIQIENGFARGFTEKPALKDYWINAGVYCFQKSIFNVLPEKGNLEEFTLPAAASEKKIQVVRYEGVNWRSIDSHKDIEEAQKEFAMLVPSRVR